MKEIVDRMTKTPELLPCPFCRGEAKIKRVTGSINYRYVKCSSCGARTKEWFGVDVAVKTWNTRVYPKEVQGAIEKQKPKEPKKDIVHYRCPNCDAMLNTYDTCEYCNYCGQKLNWSDYE